MPGDRNGPTLTGCAPASGTSGRLAELFGLLADHSRAGIVYALLEAGELSAEDLSAWTGVSPHRAYDALRVLRTARVVASRKAGDGVVYQLEGDGVRRLLEMAGRPVSPRRPWQLRAAGSGIR
ncbi:MAG TPA: transcriptional regulator [Actinomycetota bacterium]|nr:transcriptional regulator [Actinomycetota bacterium]